MPRFCSARATATSSDGAVGASFRLGERFGYESADDNCVRRQGETNELWRLDTGMLEWELILPARNQTWPAPRSATSRRCWVARSRSLGVCATNSRIRRMPTMIYGY